MAARTACSRRDSSPSSPGGKQRRAEVGDVLVRVGDRRYLGFPAGISGSELTVGAVGQARKFGTRMATPYRAVALEPGAERHLFAVGEVRSGSVKRCATAVGEGAMVVRFVHERFSADVVESPAGRGS